MNLVIKIYLTFCIFSIYTLYEIRNKLKLKKDKVTIINILLWIFIPPFNIIFGFIGMYLSLKHIQYLLLILKGKLFLYKKRLILKSTPKVIKGDLYRKQKIKK